MRVYGELNDFLPPERRGREVSCSLQGNPAVKDLVEGLGVPHVEVALILLNGKVADFAARVRPGDRVAVYPVFTTLGALLPCSGGAGPPPPVRFALDAHLGKLARLLRLLGFDAVHSNGYRDEELVAVASREGRVVLTRDRELLKRSAVRYGYWVRATDPLAQAVEVVRRFRVRGAAAPFTRCLKCNGCLLPVESSEAVACVPPRVAAWRKEFLRCLGCGKVYWKGTHHPRLEGLVSRIHGRLSAGEVEPQEGAPAHVSGVPGRGHEQAAHTAAEPGAGLSAKAPEPGRVP